MELILFLILFPFLAAVILAVARSQAARRILVPIFGILIIIAAVAFAVQWLPAIGVVGALGGGTGIMLVAEAHAVDMIMLIGEVVLLVVILAFSFKYKRYFCVVLSVVQFIIMLFVDLTMSHPECYQLNIDRLTVIMVLVVGVVGSLICIYGFGYMRDYHHHHTDVKPRQPFFFAILFMFLGAMMGLVMSNNLVWMYFFWEITSVSSFLLIGYTKTEEAINNSFRALWMNLLGGLGFATGICFLVGKCEIMSFDQLLASGNGAILLPVALLAFAGLTKSAQLPFSRWLLGAMVAPTPTSALLHSATMVKAGVYLLLRLAPVMAGTPAGYMVAFVGGFTFLITSMLAITKSDGKQVLAYSTISNLGLITACAGVGMPETVWAGVFLIIFHAVSKSMLFQSVGAVENATGSRDIESMTGLIVRYPKMAFVMIIGICGMFLAPFGMLISKWAALKAFVDAGDFISLIMVFFVAFGSATTVFYWSKWMGKIISVPGKYEKCEHKTGGTEWFSLWIHFVLMIVICLAFLPISGLLVAPLVDGMFGAFASAAISSSNLFTMFVLLVLIIIIPLIAWGTSRKKNYRTDLAYMAGINRGDNVGFVNSFGGTTEVNLSSWYMEDVFGETKLWKPSMWITIIAIVGFLAASAGTVLTAIGGVL